MLICRITCIDNLGCSPASYRARVLKKMARDSRHGHINMRTAPRPPLLNLAPEGTSKLIVHVLNLVIHVKMYYSMYYTTGTVLLDKKVLESTFRYLKVSITE